MYAWDLRKTEENFHVTQSDVRILRIAAHLLLLYYNTTVYRLVYVNCQSASRDTDFNNIPGLCHRIWGGATARLLRPDTPQSSFQ